MDLTDTNAVVTGGASGLGLASARRLLAAGAHVTIVDLPSSAGEAAADELGGNATFAAADVTDADQVRAAMQVATASGPLRAVVHCAGRGGPLRILDRDGGAGSLDTFEAVVRVNLVGSFNVLRLAAEAMAAAEPLGEERGVIVLTSSIAAYEGRIGQIHYAASKAGIVGMTLTGARDLARRQIRVMTIAPGVVDTPLLARLSEEARAGLAAEIPHPSRLATAEEFADLAAHIIDNPVLNGEVIRMDGALRMTPR